MTRGADVVCRCLIVLAGLLASIPDSSAAGVRVWQTRFDDGTRREQALDITAYGPDQDADYELLREMPAPAVQSSPAQQAGRIEIDPGQSRQTVKGLGASMTDASAYVLAELRREIRRSSPTPWSGFSRPTRERGSATSGSRWALPTTPRPTATTPTPTSRPTDLSTFSIEHDKQYIIPMLKEAIRINPEIELMGSPWSPPAWMKTNNSLIGITKQEKAAGKTCRLKPECFDLYAEYFVKYVQAYQRARHHDPRDHSAK